MGTLERLDLTELATYSGSWVEFRSRTLDVPGVQIAVAYHGEIVFSAAYGVADISTGEPLTPRHLFHVASHSKAFTATAIMKLAEQGDLRLDEPASTYVAWLRDVESPARAVTVAELLAHSSGLTRDGASGDHWQLQNPFPDEDRLKAIVRDNPRVFESNDRFHYSNVGYSILGSVVESITGSFNEFVSSSISNRLGLTHTFPDFVSSHSQRYASGHTHRGNGLDRIPIDHVNTGAMMSATGFTSTAEDLVRFFSAHSFGDTRILSDASKRRMQHPVWTQHKHEHYGLGLQLLDIGDRRLIGHSGGYPGHRTKTWSEPKENIAVLVLTNAIDGPAPELCKGVFTLIDHVSRLEDSDGGELVDLSGFVGRFVSLWETYDIASFKGQLFYIPLMSNDPVESIGSLTIESDNRARLVKARDGYVSEGELFTFDRDSNGTIERVVGPSSMSAYPQDEYKAIYFTGGRVSPRWHP